MKENWKYLKWVIFLIVFAAIFVNVIFFLQKNSESGVHHESVFQSTKF